MEITTRYYCWWYWYKGDVRMLWRYTLGWAFQFGKKPYCFFVFLASAWTFLILTLILLLNPIVGLYKRPPVFSPRFIRPMHIFLCTGIPEEVLQHVQNKAQCFVSRQAAAIRGFCQSIPKVISARCGTVHRVQSVRAEERDLHPRS